MPQQSREYDIYTLGFSNRSWEDTLAILRAFEIERLIDIRRYPGSRKFPHFGKEHLERSLPEAEIEYVHLIELGGRRKPSATGALNAGWRSDSFRAYADYMQTSDFVAALDRLIDLSREARSVMVCTEAVFWRCHRMLVSDAMEVRGLQVGHIFSATKCEPHCMTPFASVSGAFVTYPQVDTTTQGVERPK